MRATRQVLPSTVLTFVIVLSSVIVLDRKWPTLPRGPRSIPH